MSVTSATTVDDLAHKESTDGNQSPPQPSDSTSSLSLEALCQAAKSELQNISKESQQEQMVIEYTTDDQNAALNNREAGGVVESDVVYRQANQESGSSRQYTTLLPASSYSVIGAKDTVLAPEKQLRTNFPIQVLQKDGSSTQTVYTYSVQDCSKIVVPKPVTIVSNRFSASNRPNQSIDSRLELLTPEGDVPPFKYQPSGGRKRKHPAKPGRHVCPYCGHGCAKPSVLEKHIRSHTNERPFPCVPCDISFKTKSNLYKHCKSRAHKVKIGQIKGTTFTDFDASTGSLPNEADGGGRSFDNGSFDNASNQAPSSQPSDKPSSVIVLNKPIPLTPQPPVKYVQLGSASTVNTTPLIRSLPAGARIVMLQGTQSIATPTSRLTFTTAGNRSEPMFTTSAMTPPVVEQTTPQPLNVVLVPQPDGTMLLKQAPSVMPNVVSPSEVFVSNPLTSTPIMSKKGVDSNSQLNVMKYQVGKTILKSSAPSASTGIGTRQLMTVSPSHIVTMTSQHSSNVAHFTPISVAHLPPMRPTPGLQILQTARSSSMRSIPTSTVAVLSSASPKTATSGLTPADVTARISYLIDKNQAIVNTPMSEPPRQKRILRQRSEMVPVNPANQNLGQLSVSAQKLNRAQSMDTSLLNQPRHGTVMMTSTPRGQPIGVVNVMQDQQPEYVSAMESDGELLDESGDSVVVLEQVHNTRDPVILSSNDRLSNSQAGVREMVLRRSASPPHPLLHHSESVPDTIVQQSLYNYTCTKCNEELSFVDIKSIQDHVALHKQQSHVVSEQVLIPPQGLMHSKSDDVSANAQKYKQSLFLPSKSLDSIQPKKSSADTKQHDQLILEIVDPTKPLRRGRPKGAKNLPRGQGSTESENAFFFGSTRSSEGSTQMIPKFIARSIHSSISLDRSSSVALNFSNSSPHKDVTSLDGNRKDGGDVRMMLKDKILKRKVDHRNSSSGSFEHRQMSAPIGKSSTKEIVRQTRSLDEASPPTKRPKLMRQFSVVENTPSVKRDRFQRQVVFDDTGTMDHSLQESPLIIVTENSRTTKGDLSLGDSVDTSSSLDRSDSFKKPTAVRPRIPLITVTSDDIDGNETSIVSDVMDDGTCELVAENPQKITAMEKSTIHKKISNCETDSKSAENISAQSRSDSSGLSFELGSSKLLSDQAKLVLNNIIMRRPLTSVTIDVSHPVTNCIDAIGSTRPPRHAPFSDRVTLQSKFIPRSVAGKIPGMIKTPGDLDLDFDLEELRKESRDIALINSVLTEKAKETDPDDTKMENSVEKDSPPKDESSTDQSESLSELPENLQDKSEVVFTLVGHNYPVLRTNTHTTLCSVHKPQPMYITQDTNQKLSMYSTWRAAPFNPNPNGITTKQLLDLYDSRNKGNQFVTSPACDVDDDNLDVIHSSYWQSKEMVEDDVGRDGRKGDVISSVREAASKFKVKIVSHPKIETQSSLGPPATAPIIATPKVEQAPLQRADTDPSSYTVTTGVPNLEANISRRRLMSSLSTPSTNLGFKSDEVHPYIRGRGRGQYVCKECGIRCKKPSMLKKHLRTHTDLRPFICKYCKFAFKTKGNLTKHMKSKSHHKKCVEIGIVPVPTQVDDTCIESSQYSIQRSAFAETSLLGSRASYTMSTDDTGQPYSVMTDDVSDDDDDEEEEEDEQEVEEEQVDMDNMVVLEEPESDVTEATVVEAEHVSNDVVTANEPRYIKVQHVGSGEPMLIRLVTDSDGQTRGNLVDIATKSLLINNDKPRDSTTNEVAASLLDLSKRGDKQGGSKSSMKRGVAFDISDVDLHTTPKKSSRVARTDIHKDPAFAVIDHPMLYSSNIQSNAHTSPKASMASPGADGRRKQALLSYDAVTALSPYSGFVPPRFSLTTNTVTDNSVSQTVVDSLASTHESTRALKSVELLQSDESTTALKNLEASQSATHVRTRALDDLEVTHGAVGQQSTLPDLQTASPVVVLKIPNSEKFNKQDLDDTIATVLKQVQLESKQKVVLEIQLSETSDEHGSMTHTSASSALTSQVKDEYLGACVNPQEVHSEQFTSARLPFVKTPVRARLTDLQIKQMDPSLQDTGSASRMTYQQRVASRGETTSGLVTPQSPRRLSRLLKRQASFSEPDQSSAISGNSRNLPEQTETIQQHEIQIVNPKLKTGEVTLHKIQIQKGGVGGSGQLDSTAQSGLLKRRTSGQQMEPMPGKIHNIEKVNGKFKCTLCNKKFPELALLQAHLKAHAFDHPYRCSICNSAFRTQIQLDRHILSDSHLAQLDLNGRLGLTVGDNPRPYQCQDCGVAFRIHGHLARHLRCKNHVTTLENLGKLPMGTFMELEKSQFVGNNISVVDSHSNLNDTLKVIYEGNLDVDTSDFKWPPMFTQTNSAPAIRQTSLVETPAVKTTPNLTSRSLSMSNTPHKCGICGRSFCDIDLLKEHLVSHAEIRPYVCHHCDAGFTMAHSLETHLATHSPERTARRQTCDLCHADFNSAQELIDHFKTHRGLGPSSRHSPVKSMLIASPSVPSQLSVTSTTSSSVTSSSLMTSHCELSSASGPAAIASSQHNQNTESRTDTGSEWANMIGAVPEMTSPQSVSSTSGLDCQPSFRIVQNSGSNEQVEMIPFSADAIEMKEVLQTGEDGVEKQVKVVMINWAKVQQQKQMKK